MADQPKEESVSTAPAVDEDRLLQPWEKAAPSEHGVHKDLFDLLDSEFDDEEDSEDADELESDDESGDTDDDEDEGDDEDDAGEEADDEDEGDDEDVDDEEDANDVDDEDSDEDSDDEPERRPVKVGGKVVERVTFDEAIAGYSRMADYTRKRQADVELRKQEVGEHATHMVGVRAAREQYDTGLQNLVEVMKSLHPAQPDWEKLRRDNPGEYAAEKADYAEREAAIERVEKERTRVSEEKNEEDLAAQEAFVQAQMVDLQNAVPGWENTTALEAGLVALSDFAKEAYGFSEQELSQVMDHRLLLMLREVMESRAKTTKGKKEIRKKSKGKPKLKPGGTRNTKSKAKRGQRKARQRAGERLARSGSVHDAADLIEYMLGDDD